MTEEENKLYKKAYILSLITIFFNLAEGFASIIFGYEDETLTLFGFGIDSFIEVISGLGIFYMIRRIWREPDAPKKPFEKTAVRITGIGFYVLSIGLSAGIINNLITKHTPETTVSGVIISIISLAIMGWLVYQKFKTGKKLNSDPIILDAKCSLVCIYMSLVLLISSVIYEFTQIGLIDILGTIGIIYFSVREGKEAFEIA